MASPCLGSGSPHEVIASGARPAPPTALNSGLERAGTGWSFASIRTSTYPRVGTGCSSEQYRQAEERFGPIGVAGVYGVGDVIATARRRARPTVERVGWVVDRDRRAPRRP